MIKATFERVDGHIISYETEGHALFADHGNDIVCSAVSALVTTITNGIVNQTDAEFNVVDVAEGLLTVSLIRGDSRTDALIETLLTGLESIAEQYPKNIEVKVI